MVDLVLVRFLRQYPPYNATEIAGFSAEQAAALVAAGHAEPAGEASVAHDPALSPVVMGLTEASEVDAPAPSAVQEANEGGV